MFITYNTETKQIYTAEHQNTTLTPEGHELIEIDMQFSDFPAHPSYCRIVNGEVVHDTTISLELQISYAEKRALEYPPMADYIDGVVKGDQEQVQAYIDACLAVKAKYPKE